MELAVGGPSTGFWRAFPWLLGAVALGMRLLGHAGSGLWFDEIWTLIDFGRLPLGELLTTFGSDNNHPLYSLTSALSLRAFGESALALRLPAILFGAASVPLMWTLALQVTERREALLATLLMLLSYHQVWFSQNARGYTMLLFFTLGASHFFLALYRRREARDLAGYAACMALGTYAHSSAVFVALAHGLIALPGLAFGREPAAVRLRPLLALGAAGAGSLLLHAGILRGMIAFYSPSEGGKMTSVPSEWTSPFFLVKASAESLGFGLVPGLVVLFGALLVLGVGVLSYARQDLRTAAVFVLPGLIGAAVMLGLGRNLWPRFFFNLAGFMLLIVVRGVFVLATWLAARFEGEVRARLERALPMLGAAVLLAGSLAILPRAYLLPKQDFEGALAYVRANAHGDEVVMAGGLTVMPYRDYYRAGLPEVSTPAELDARLAGKRAGYFLHTLPTYLDSRHPELAAALRERAEEVARFRGSVGDGDLIVLRILPRAEARKGAEP